MWKQPARLWRQREPAVAGKENVRPKQIASGSLEEMVRRAVERAGRVEARERHAFFIDVDARELLGWPDIARLSDSPGFPVEI
ncbi:hypothetical protein SAMN05192583_1440 [Sphingomonas gellani]|uniref:Uncharacterized protein n=1 Tax=Sphingomonas gellani TaxID=1166340 RepID=A0A1H8C358_9SPHN|nr:hypothetical protein [Sphingomonas gellani]SEM89601.1 hypothetical protein SAMN05192583_1440 [Sphingomonas gellani]